MRWESNESRRKKRRGVDKVKEEKREIDRKKVTSKKIKKKLSNAKTITIKHCYKSITLYTVVYRLMWLFLACAVVYFLF